MELKDTYWHKGMRKRLVDSLRQKSIQDEKVLAAMEAVPRHFFMENAFEEIAYEDKAFPIGCEQTISQPYTVAFQTELLEVKKGDKILEIGTGSGYQATVLAALGAFVYTLERQEELFQKTKILLTQLGVQQVRCVLRDGFGGLPEYAPFDKILVTAGASSIPETLKMQLKIGAYLVIPVGEATQEMYRVERKSAQQFEANVFGSFRFVPFMAGIHRKDGASK